MAYVFLENELDYHSTCSGGSRIFRWGGGGAPTCLEGRRPPTQTLRRKHMRKRKNFILLRSGRPPGSANDMYSFSEKLDKHVTKRFGFESRPVDIHCALPNCK